jgi:hypothetical protein
MVIPASSDHDPAGSGARCSRATGCPGRTLAAASMKDRTISSGVAPGSGRSGSMPTTSAGGAGACVICTVGELIGTVEQAVSTRSRASATTVRRPVTAAPPAA